MPLSNGKFIDRNTRNKIEAYQGSTCQELANEYKCSTATIYDWFQTYG